MATVVYRYICCKCGTPRAVQSTDEGLELVRGFNLKIACPSCTDRYERQFYDQRVQPVDPKLEEVNRWIPVDYQDSDEERFPQQFMRCKYWMPGKRGLLLYGPTRRFKSRIAYWIVRRMIMLGTRVEAYDCRTFRAEVERRIHAGTLFDWYDIIKTVPVLLLDDIGKFKGEGKRIEEELFSIVKMRVEARLGIIITTNDTDTELQSRFSKTIGEPLVARLVESCDVVSFFTPEEEQTAKLGAGNLDL